MGISPRYFGVFERLTAYFVFYVTLEKICLLIKFALNFTDSTDFLPIVGYLVNPQFHASEYYTSLVQQI